MEIKRISKFSDIMIIERKELNDFNKKFDRKIIQVVSENDLICVEYILDGFDEEYIEEQTPKFKTESKADSISYVEELKTKEDKELESALDTVFTNDPLRKYSGCTLREMFDNHDEQSINWYLNNLHNKYICDKIKLIVQSGYSR